MDISAVIMGFNEEKNIPSLFTSLKGLSDVVFIDHHSTDQTAKLAKEYGARVFVREFHCYGVANKKDIREFEERFGFKPTFTIGQKMFDGGYERNWGAEQAKNDWILNIDCDERVTWDLEEIKKLLPTADQIGCKFYHMPDYSFLMFKLYNKKVSQFIAKSHEAVEMLGVRIITDKMKIDHFNRNLLLDRSNLLSKLEYQALKEYTSRNIYYLAREYYAVNRYKDSIQLFNLYLKTARFNKEIQTALLFMTHCYIELKDKDKARQHCLWAIGVCPNCVAALELMSTICDEKNSDTWKRFATQVQNEEVYF